MALHVRHKGYVPFGIDVANTLDIVPASLPACRE